MLPAPLPVFPPPPAVYNASVFANWVRQLVQYLKKVNNGGPIVASRLKLTDLPTSAVGLESGELWHDTATHAIKIVP